MISKAWQLRSIRRNFLIPISAISDMTLSMHNMEDERGAVLTQSAKVWTHRVRPPPFWLIITALDRNRYLPMQLWQNQQTIGWMSETWGWCVKFIILSSFMDLVCQVRNKMTNIALMMSCLCTRSSVILVFISLVALQLWKQMLK